MVRVVAVLVVLGCSHPPTTNTKRAWHPDDTPDVAAVNPSLFRYDWPRRREEGTPTVRPWPSKCGPTRGGPSPSTASFHFPKGPEDVAALVGRHFPGKEPRTTRLILDLGRGSHVDESWSGVLLDDRGFALHEWTCVTMDGGAITLVVPLPLVEAQRYKRVALFQDPPPLGRSR